MKQIIQIIVVVFFLFSCQEDGSKIVFKKYDEIDAVKLQLQHANKRMQFQLFQSKYLDLNIVFKPFKEALSDFSESDYQQLKSLILEKSIRDIQRSVRKGKLTYEKLTLFYLYRIRKFESDSLLSLNSIISLNPTILKQAREKDEESKTKVIPETSIFGMPILLKDNINAKGMATTAGAVALIDNFTEEDAYITQKLKQNGALILGKANLSEWAYFFCSGCPLGYSAVGGQTLNPYGRGDFETGGSSSGSAVAVAANFAVAAVGTETSGSITSPSSLNSVVGFKPTVGTFSRSGIVPISNTLDTPGPMTKNVIDNFILYAAMLGHDREDLASIAEYPEGIETINTTFKGVRMGVFKSLLADSVYAAAVEKMRDMDAEIVEIIPPEINLEGFITMLNLEMKFGLPNYLAEKALKNNEVTDVQSVINFNKKDSLFRAPYGQQLFEGIVNDTTSLKELIVIREKLKVAAAHYFDFFETEKLNTILSINNYHSGVAALGMHPTITVPMGYRNSGEPVSLTFIGTPYRDISIVEFAYIFEQNTKVRKIPKNYQ